MLRVYWDLNADYWIQSPVQTIAPVFTNFGDMTHRWAMSNLTENGRRLEILVSDVRVWLLKKDLSLYATRKNIQILKKKNPKKQDAQWVTFLDNI